MRLHDSLSRPCATFRAKSSSEAHAPSLAAASKRILVMHCTSALSIVCKYLAWHSFANGSAGGSAFRWDSRARSTLCDSSTLGQHGRRGVL
eukprot:CAMPEP_0180509756 /NCGR_PEP_ID=MMETSP1036_2-20121128/49899_1 /TAXON_ID=632150 /ORGANISM="Azadinium spinosum, Strain 3D9" /LENGTH=90 /DNA_ID=CAMNT_0022520199 /DNA_START=1 /DNA_END=273 /DNA_ORIENTATION=-